MGYLYDATSDTYVSPAGCSPGRSRAITACWRGPARHVFPDRRLDPEFRPDGGRRLGAARARIAITPGGPFPGSGGSGAATVVNIGQRNVAAVAALNDTTFLRLTTPVRQNITTATRDDPRTTLEMVNLLTGEDTLVGVAPENPVSNVFGTTRSNVPPRQMVVDSAGTRIRDHALRD